MNNVWITCKNKVLPFQGVLHLISISLSLSFITSKNNYTSLKCMWRHLDRQKWLLWLLYHKGSMIKERLHNIYIVLSYSSVNSANNLIFVWLVDHLGWDWTFWTASKATVCPLGSIWQMCNDLTNWLCADVTQRFSKCFVQWDESHKMFLWPFFPSWSTDSDVFWSHEAA